MLNATPRSAHVCSMPHQGVHMYAQCTLFSLPLISLCVDQRPVDAAHSDGSTCCVRKASMLLATIPCSQCLRLVYAFQVP